MTVNLEQPTTAGFERMLPSERRYSYWYSAAVLVCLALLAALLLFRQTVSVTIHTWYTSETYSYGYIILPIVGYVVWQRRQRLHAVPLRPFWPGLALVACSCLLWLAGSIADTRLLQQVALVCTLDTMLLTVLGLRAARTLAAPMILLFFTVPFGESMVPKLQDLTAWTATSLLNLSQVPALLEGRVITVPGAQWQVAEACSGARYLISSTIMGVVLAFLIYRSWKRRLALMAASIAVPVAANCIRAYGIILLGYLSGNKLAHGVDHIIYGWIFFSFCMLLVFGMALRRAEPRAEPIVLPLEARGGSVELVQLAAAALACCALMVLPVTAANRLRQHQMDVRLPVGPRTNSQWNLTGNFPLGWISPGLDGALGDAEAYRPAAGTADRQVYLFVGSSRANARVLGSGERLMNLNRWTLLGEGDRIIEIRGHRLPVRELRTQGPGYKRLVWLWCMVDGHATNAEFEVKLLQARAVLTGRPNNVEIIAVAADYDFQPNDAAPALRSFLDNATPEVLGEAGRGSR